MIQGNVNIDGDLIIKQPLDNYNEIFSTDNSSKVN